MAPMTVKGTNAFAYDPIGNLIRHTDPEGRIKQFLRDAAGDFLQPVALESSETPQSASSTALGHKNQSEEAPNPQATRGNEILPSDSRRTDPPPFGLPRTPIPGRESYGQPIRAAQFGDLHYRYDAAGNVIERRTKHRKTRFEWDCANRLIRGRGADGIPVYMGYDAMGRRLSKTLKGHRITFGWDGEALMAEHGDHGWREYIMQPGGFTPVALIEGGQVFHFETDQVGLPYELLNCDGDVVWSADYDAWGGITRLAKERVKNPLRLQGQYADDELGIAYNSFRYFDSLSGGFISKDPLGLTAGENLFSFGPQALTWIDPLGLAGDPANATHITYEGIKKGKPYVGYASKPGLGHSADDVLKYRYPNTYKFDVAPTPIYVGDGQIGKNTARGLEQRVFEEKGGLQGTSNKRNPVGVGNPNRDDYLSAADEHRKKLGTTC